MAPHKNPFIDRQNGEIRHIYIREASALLNRRMGTLRKWDQTGVLPEELRPHRGHGGSNWRFWTLEQIEGIKEWIRQTQRYSGNALPHYNPTDKELDKVIKKMRDTPHGKTSRLKENA